MAGTGRSSRDNFSQSVVMILSKRAGGKCCKCATPTFGPNDNPNKATNIGQAAHIAAAAPGGPRYDPKMSPEERTSTSNGLWLCSNCHDVVDRNPELYKTSDLKRMKKEAEERARKEMGVAKTPQHTKDAHHALTTGVSAAAVLEIRKAKARLVLLHGQKGLREQEASTTDLLENLAFLNFQADPYLPQVGNELLAFLTRLLVFCNEPLDLLEVIRQIKVTSDTFHMFWDEEDVKMVTDVMEKLVYKHTGKKSAVRQSSLALLKDLCGYRYNSRRARKLVQIPRGVLRRADMIPGGGRGGGRDETDAGPDDGGEIEPPAVKKMAVVDKEEEQYKDALERLADSRDPEEVSAIENEIRELGYEPNVV